MIWSKPSIFMLYFLYNEALYNHDYLLKTVESETELRAIHFIRTYNGINHAYLLIRLQDWFRFLPSNMISSVLLLLEVYFHN